MRTKPIKVLLLILFALPVIIARTSDGHAQNSDGAPPPVVVPKAWDDAALAALELPLAGLNISSAHVSSEYYYSINVRPIYKTYPVYSPGKEPAGYLEWLKKQEAQVIFDASKLKTQEDWIKAGEDVYDYPTAFRPITELHDISWFGRSEVPVAKDGTIPFVRYVIRKNGVVEIGRFSCAMCHTRVLPNGEIVKGAQGNFPLGSFDGFLIRQSASRVPDATQFLNATRTGSFSIYGAPWLKPDPNERIKEMSVEEIASAHEAIPPGVQARFATSLFYPVIVPDLIGVKNRRYLDRTGLDRHRSIEDLMRYAALNQGAALLDRYGDYINPQLKLPDPKRLSRYGDEQLYALALYLYSLKPPPNPNKMDSLAARGKKVFAREGCATCHTPPLYTNNKLTPAEGFKVPPDHLNKYDISNASIGTDPGLATKTRRGTGYYKVPSLLGVWYRGPFEHNGSVATLEDWFDPRRVSEGYEPTGFKGVGVKKRAVKGHLFGLNLSEADRKALIAFLKTL